MNSNKNVVAEFTDKYGDKRQIHHTRHGLKVKNKKTTPILMLNPVIGRLVGEKIREKRKERGMTLEELCVKAGISSSTPKSRMWEIEKGVRGEGLRFGTLYVLAIALDVEVDELLPTKEEVMDMAGLKFNTIKSLSIAK